MRRPGDFGEAGPPLDDGWRIVPVTLIDFDAPDIADGPLPSVTRDGVTVRFVTPARLVPLRAAGLPGRALVNSGQERHDETGHQKPLLLEFDRLQRRVRMRVGLEDADPSVDEVVATLRAFDASGGEVARTSRSLGGGLRRRSRSKWSRRTT